MKKTISLVLVLLVVFTVGCGINNTKMTSGQSEQAQTPAQNQPFDKVPDTSNYIGEEKAKGIALSRAGLSEADVRFDRVELDRDNGVWRYEVEFRNGRTEYDADIKADDGTVLKWEIDMDD